VKKPGKDPDKYGEKSDTEDFEGKEELNGIE